MYKEVLDHVDGIFDAILAGSLPEKIAKVTRKMHDEFGLQGFTREESVQFISAILSKKS